MTDEAIPKNRRTSDESKRQQCLGPASCKRLTSVHSVLLKMCAAQSPSVMEENLV